MLSPETVLRLLPALFASLAIGAAAPQDQPAPADVGGMRVEYEVRCGPRTLVHIWADGRGNATTVYGAGHGGIGFLTRDSEGYVMLGYQPISLGREEDLAALMVGAREGSFSRVRIERLTRQRLEIIEVGTERILGIEGRVYRLTLIEGQERLEPLEIVISTDPRLAAVGREILRHIDLLRDPIFALVGEEPQPFSAARALFATGTPLRIDRLKMIRMETETRAARAEGLVLPGPVVSRRELHAEMGRPGSENDDHPDLPFRVGDGGGYHCNENDIDTDFDLDNLLDSDFANEFVNESDDIPNESYDLPDP